MRLGASKQCRDLAPSLGPAELVGDPVDEQEKAAGFSWLAHSALCSLLSLLASHLDRAAEQQTRPDKRGPAGQEEEKRRGRLQFGPATVSTARA